MNTQQLNEAIYIHSYDKYMNSFKLNHKVYWGRKHMLVSTALGKPNLVLKEQMKWG